MPRGPGKKENYNLDYSRFSSFDRDESEDVAKVVPKQQAPQDDADAAAGLPDMRDLLRGMPVELQEAYHLMGIAKANGDTKAQQRASELALEAVQKGGPEVRNEFMKNVAKQMPDIAGKLSKDMSGVATADPKVMLQGLQEEAVRQAAAKNMAVNPEDTEIRIGDLRTQMEEGQKATRAEMENLNKKQAELEGIQNPEDFMKFMESEGITPDDLQRIFGGDEKHMQATLNETLEKNMKKGVEHRSEDSKEALKKVEELHGTLFGTEGEEKPEEPKPEEKPVRRAPEPKEPEVTIPQYRLQYQKDDKGKYTSVELKCTLPGIVDMSAINLDVSERHLRLSTIAPAPRYAVNAGPFPVLIDASGARAKYSKKREELSISVPAKA